MRCVRCSRNGRATSDAMMLGLTTFAVYFCLCEPIPSAPSRYTRKVVCPTVIEVQTSKAVSSRSACREKGGIVTELPSRIDVEGFGPRKTCGEGNASGHRKGVHSRHRSSRSYTQEIREMRPRRPVRHAPNADQSGHRSCLEACIYSVYPSRTLIEMSATISSRPLQLSRPMVARPTQYHWAWSSRRLREGCGCCC